MPFSTEDIRLIALVIIVIIVVIAIIRMMNKPRAENYHNAGRGPMDHRGFIEGRGPYVGNIINDYTAYDNHC